MSLESDLFTVLKTVTPQVFPDVAPNGTVPPYITYAQVGGDAPTFLGREVPSKENAVVSVEYWSTTRADSKTKIKAVESALTLATVFQAKPDSAARAVYTDDVDLRGMQQDFNIWATR